MAAVNRSKENTINVQSIVEQFDEMQSSGEREESKIASDRKSLSSDARDYLSKKNQGEGSQSLVHLSGTNSKDGD